MSILVIVKQNLPISVTPFGISILLKLKQSEKAYFPILVTLIGISIVVRLHPSNVYSPISTTPLGMIYSVSPAGAKAIIFLSTIRHLPSSDASLLLNSVRLKQPWNTNCPISVTQLGMNILVRLRQPLKADSPI